MSKTMIAYTPETRAPVGSAQAVAAAYIDQWCKTKPLEELQPSRAARLICSAKLFAGKEVSLQGAIRELKIERMQNE